MNWRQKIQYGYRVIPNPDRTMYCTYSMQIQPSKYLPTPINGPLIKKNCSTNIIVGSIDAVASLQDIKHVRVAKKKNQIKWLYVKLDSFNFRYLKNRLLNHLCDSTITVVTVQCVCRTKVTSSTSAAAICWTYSGNLLRIITFFGLQQCSRFVISRMIEVACLVQKCSV